MSHRHISCRALAGPGPPRVALASLADARLSTAVPAPRAGLYRQLEPLEPWR